MTEIQIKQVIGQQEASIDKIEAFLTPVEFREYCDAIAVTTTYWKCFLKTLRDLDNPALDYKDE